jgi:hypothetical protein
MAKRKHRDTRYTNTDLDLKSTSPFPKLREELEASCTLLHYTHGDDNNWHAIVESRYPDEEHTDDRTAVMDIRLILNAIQKLSGEAKVQLDQCYMKEFNLGFDCWDTWSFVHSLPTDILREISDYSCSIAVTLYSMRDTDGKPKE